MLKKSMLLLTIISVISNVKPADNTAWNAVKTVAPFVVAPVLFGKSGIGNDEACAASGAVILASMADYSKCKNMTDYGIVATQEAIKAALAYTSFKISKNKTIVNVLNVPQNPYKEILVGDEKQKDNFTLPAAARFLISYFMLKGIVAKTGLWDYQIK